MKRSLLVLTLALLFGAPSAMADNHAKSCGDSRCDCEGKKDSESGDCTCEDCKCDCCADKEEAKDE